MKIIADKFIPFLQGRLEQYADIEYIDPADFCAYRVADADALLIRTRTRCGEPLLKDSKVRFIATATIGMDQFDLPWCKAHGIATANAPGCNAPGVAQYVWSSLLRMGMKPGVHCVGIVGCGNVGRIVKEWGETLGFKILVNDPPRAVVEGEAGFTSLETLLAESDAVTFHTPLTRSGDYPSFHLLNTDNVRLLKSGGIIVNAARGPVTDTDALLRAHEERGSRLVVDTWEGEPGISRELLNIADIATFHVAGYSLQGKQRATRMAVEALCRHFSLPLPNLDDLARPYTPGVKVDADEILRSYNPLTDTVSLRDAPDMFEQMRDHYIYRSEPSFVCF